MPFSLLLEIQRYEDIVRCVAAGTLFCYAKESRRKRLTQTLIVGLQNGSFIHFSLMVKSQQMRIELVTRPLV